MRLLPRRLMGEAKRTDKAGWLVAINFSHLEFQ
jgi:hypothetical protein